MSGVLLLFLKRTFSPVLFITLGIASLTGCGGHKQAKAPIPPPVASQPAPPAPSAKIPPSRTVKPLPPGEEAPPPETAKPTDPELLAIPSDARPLSVETGLASWYGPPYHNRRGSNGQIYDMNAPTAAHKTLPLGSIVRVVNVKTEQSVVVRITDRGPFVKGRIIDLSLAAAKDIDLVRAGVAPVRVELLRTPAAANSAGKWAVQIGAFARENAAIDMADHLSRRYRTAKVLHFGSPVGDWWVRVRVLGDDRNRAEEVAHDTKTSEGRVFLVRLD